MMTEAAGPLAGVALGRAIDQKTTLTYRGLLSQKENDDLRMADRNFADREKSAFDTLSALARANVDPNSPEYVAAHDQLANALNERMLNPRMAYSQEQRDFDAKRYDSELGAQRFLYGVDQAYKNASPVEARQKAEEAAQDVLTNPKYNGLSMQQRQEYYHQALGEARANDAILRQDRAEAQQAFADLKDAVRLGGSVDPADVDRVEKAMKATGDQAGIASLHAFASRAPLVDQSGKTSLDDQAATIDRLRGGAAQAGAAAQDSAYYGNIPKPSDGVYAKIPPVGEHGEQQLPRFQQWNNDPVGNSAANLATVHPDLQAIVRRAQADNPDLKFVVALGKATPQQEAQAQAWGWSPGPGNHGQCLAVDLWPLDKEGHVVFDKDKQQAINAAMQRAAGELGQSVKWGGLTTEGGANHHFRDAPNFELLPKAGVTAGAGNASIGDLSSYKARVAQIEDPSGNPYAVSSAGAVGKYQFMPATWVKYGGGGDIHGDQEAAMDRLTEDNRRQLEQGLGRPPTGAELYLAHQQGPQGFLHLLADPSRRAADVVGLKAVTGNGGTANMTAGEFVSMWENKFNRTTGVPIAGMGDHPAGSLWELNNRERFLDSQLRASWGQMMTDYKTDNTYPNQADLSSIFRGARTVGDSDLLEEIGQQMNRIDTARGVSTMPLGQQQQIISQGQAMAGGGGISPGQAATLHDVEKRYEAITTGLRDNPISTTVKNFGEKFAAPAPLDFQDPGKLIAGLKQRDQIAQFAAQNWGSGPVSALDKEEVAQFKSALQSPDPGVKAGLFGALSTPSEPVRGGDARQARRRDSEGHGGSRGRLHDERAPRYRLQHFPRSAGHCDGQALRSRRGTGQVQLSR
jgi:hypothetical protein